jgi:pyrroline-5-carboxylate reductase
MNPSSIAILGAGNIGTSIANGLLASGLYSPESIVLTRRKVHLLHGMREKGFAVTKDNREAVRKAEAVLVAVEPDQLDGVLAEVAPELVPGKHVVVSVVTGAPCRRIVERVGKGVSVVRAMPNTAIAVRESMTCLASGDGNGRGIEAARAIFDTVGKTVVIREDEMTAATALGACGVAFFLRAIRAASQGGIEIGFHSDEAIAIAAQTARGAATLLLTDKNHPEFEIDKVTTPKGCTISGLNQMEHEGFSSAMIRGIVVSAKKASELYKISEGE